MLTNQIEWSSQVRLNLTIPCFRSQMSLLLSSIAVKLLCYKSAIIYLCWTSRIKKHILDDCKTSENKTGIGNSNSSYAVLVITATIIEFNLTKVLLSSRSSTPLFSSTEKTLASFKYFQQQSNPLFPFCRNFLKTKYLHF